MSAPDDRRPDDDTLDDADRELAARVATVLVARAGALVVADEAFDPTRAATLDLADDPGHRRPGDAPGRGPAGPVELEPLPVTPIGTRRRGWSTWVAGLAAAAVLVAAIVAVNAVRQPSVDTGNSDPLVAPGSAWAPSWLPDGLELWRVDVSEGDAETAHAEANAGAGWYLIGYRQGLKLRMEAVQAHIDACIAEEAGARDALSEAFEALKKYEQVEANAKAAAAKELAKRETAALDELGLRRKAVR